MCVVLGRRHRLLHVRSLFTRWYEREQEVHQVSSWPLFDSKLLHQERSIPRSPLREERRGSRVFHSESAQKEMQKTTILEHSRSFHPWCKIPKDHDRNGSHWRSDSWDGQIDERGSHTARYWRRNQCQSWQLVDPFEFCGFRHDAHKASSWLQRSIVYLASSQESRGSSLLPKLVANLFLVLVTMTTFLVTSLIWDITATMDPALIDRGNLLNGDWTNCSWNDSQHYFDAELQWQFGTNSNLLSSTEGVKRIPPNTENWLRKRVDENDDNNMSNETKRETNYSETTTRATCTSLEHERRARTLVHLFILSHTSLAHDLSLVISSP